MPSSYRIKYLLIAPAIVVVGLFATFWGRRAVSYGNKMHRWADSLEHGSGPVRIDAGFVPLYVDGRHIGTLQTLVVERHQHGTVDSLSVTVRPSGSADAAALTACAYHLSDLKNFQPESYKYALNCAADTTGLVRFGSVSFGKAGQAPLFVDPSDAACAVDVTVNVGVGTDSARLEQASAKAACADYIRSEVRRNIRTIDRAEIQRIVRDAQEQARQGREAAAQARRLADSIRRAERR